MKARAAAKRSKHREEMRRGFQTVPFWVTAQGRFHCSCGSIINPGDPVLYLPLQRCKVCRLCGAKVIREYKTPSAQRFERLPHQTGTEGT